MWLLKRWFRFIVIKTLLHEDWNAEDNNKKISHKSESNRADNHGKLAVESEQGTKEAWGHDTESERDARLLNNSVCEEEACQCDSLGKEHDSESPTNERSKVGTSKHTIAAEPPKQARPRPVSLHSSNRRLNCSACCIWIYFKNKITVYCFIPFSGLNNLFRCLCLTVLSQRFLLGLFFIKCVNN